jgi:protoporphyrinogen oxidase
MPNAGSPVASKKVVILGAGLGGLSAGWMLQKQGYQVELIEKSAEVGGLAATKTYHQYRYDLGPHNIHTHLQGYLTFLKTHFKDSLSLHFPKAKIFKGGKLVDYPLQGSKVLTSLKPYKLPFAGATFVNARVKMFLRAPRKDKDASFEDWIRNRFGDVLFDEYFGPYASKVWGVNTTEVDKYVAEERIPVISLTELTRAFLFGKRAGADHVEFYPKDNYYLKNGIGEIAEFFKKELVADGAHFHFETTPVRIDAAGHRVTGVSVEDKDGKSSKLPADYVLSTIPINEAVQLLEHAPADVREAARSLDYCATVLLFLVVDREGLMPSATLYYNDGLVPFSRVYDVGGYSKEMVPAGKSLLCLEFPCTVGDEIWTATVEDLREQAIAALQQAIKLEDQDVTDAFTERISHSYPRFRLGFQARLRTVFDHFKALQNFISYGRQGGFAYINTDQVVTLGFQAAAAINGAQIVGQTCGEWFHANS